LEANGAGHAFPDDSDVRGQLAAAEVDLRETAALLAWVEQVPRDSCLEDPHEVMLCVLAGPRRVELEAVAERLARMLAWQPEAAHPFPPGSAAAGMKPESS
jgi:hypothetical protein